MISKPILIFGEVLYDRFEKGGEKRGGAPFNVAWHLQGFAQNPIFISRIGNDSAGLKLLKDMSDWGMSTEAVQVDVQNPTGFVNVINEDTNPQFDIINNVAYDFIDGNKLENLNGGFIYHGSLALRNQISRTAFEQLLKSNPDAELFFDVNLRPPWSDIDIIKHFLRRTTYFKCNDSELETLSGHLNLADFEPDICANKIIQDYKLKALIVTLGEKGAIMYKGDLKFIRSEPNASVKCINSVGAGDAFSAVMILGLINNWPDELMLNRANSFAASICTIDGAVPDTKEFYDNAIKRWSEHGNI